MRTTDYAVVKSAAPKPLTLVEKAGASLALSLWTAVVLSISIQVVANAPTGDQAQRHQQAVAILQADIAR